MFYLKDAKASFGINLPTDVNEINVDHLHTITEHVNLAPNQCLIAQVMYVPIFELSMEEVKSTGTRVIPLMVKSNIPKDSTHIIRVKTGDRVLVPGSIIEMGLHAYVPSAVTYSGVRGYLDRYPDTKRAISTRSYEGSKDIKDVCIIEFKIIDAGHIKGSTPVSPKIAVDPFKVVDSASN